MSVLQVPEVSGSGDGEGGGEDGQPQGSERTTANQASEQSGHHGPASRGTHHFPGQSSCGVNSKTGEPGLLSGD